MALRVKTRLWVGRMGEQIKKKGVAVGVMEELRTGSDKSSGVESDEGSE